MPSRHGSAAAPPSAPQSAEVTQLAQRVGHLATIAEIHAKHGNTRAAADCLADAWQLLAPHGSRLRRASGPTP